MFEHITYVWTDEINPYTIFIFKLLKIELIWLALSDETRDNLSFTDLQSIAKSLLPTQADDQALRRNITTHISRVLGTNHVFFKTSFGGAESCFSTIIVHHNKYVYHLDIN